MATNCQNEVIIVERRGPVVAVSNLSQQIYELGTRFLVYHTVYPVHAVGFCTTFGEYDNETT